MTFLWPWCFFALAAVPALVAGYLWSRRRRRARAGALAASGLAATGVAARGPAAMPGRRRRGVLQHLPFGLFTVAVAVLAVACARPMTSIALPSESATMVLVVDVSNSMGASDAAPTRIAVAKAAARQLVAEEPASVRVGVVGFGQSAVIVQRPTTDHAAAVRAVDSLSLGGGTSLASGILAGVEAIAGKTLRVNLGTLDVDNSGEVDIGYYGNATLVVLSDGEDTSQTNPVDMARLASTAGVRIETLGVGSAAGTTLQIGKFAVATALDPTTLADVAKVANGSYHHLAGLAAGSSAGAAAGGGARGSTGASGAVAGSANQPALSAVSKAVVLHTTFATRHTEVTALFALGAAILLAIAAVLSTLWYGRVV
ncbi:MAG TPA: VWA domain-containing protein [Acidimicrobiales bacterium]|nr:VWA domain-containing protein [Acidimicrobiales bacterium]